MQLKRTFLVGVIGSLSLAALLGIWVFLFGGFGDTEAKIIGTTLTATLFSMTSLGAAVVLERGRWRLAMISTFVIGAIGLLVFLILIWFEQVWRILDDDLLVKIIICLVTWAVALPHMGLLSLASLKNFYLWARRAALSTVLLLAISITVCALVDGEPDEDFWLRVIGILGILTALGTITVPILAKVAGIDQEAGVESTAMQMQIICPRCRLRQTIRSGHSRCSGCKLRFEIKIEEPRCPRCDYLLHMLTEPVCPECGQVLGEDEITRPPGALPPTEATDA